MHVLTEAPATTAALRIEALCVRRGGREVLRDVSLEVPEGRITAVVGPSGVGKSTLMNVLTGLLTPTSGRIRVSGHGELGAPGVLEALRERTAMVFQDHALIDRLPAIDNVLLGLADRRHPLSPLPWSRRARIAAARALADVGLAERAGERTGRLSGGERQRVGIARALVRRPRLLIGDEPFAAVDAALARRLGSELRRLVERDGLTVLVVLHQLQLARSLADRIVALADGRVVFDGPATAFDETAEALVFPPLHPGEPPAVARPTLEVRR